ncbi:MAG: tripartite tricarboxylate transporter substrate binding protein [Clostridia bacterium]|nr:tripartite tricarboxylate transporter substrate binding protein [Clostridia bacterium]
MKARTRASRLWALAVPLVVASLLLSGCGGSQSAGGSSEGNATGGSKFPSGAIEIVAPASPGGGWDLTARAVQKALQDEGLVKVAINVVDKPGGNGIVGWTYLNGHKGDGHYVAMNSTLIFSNYYQGNWDTTWKDFTPIARLTTEYTAVAVPADSPFQTLKDLLEKLKQDPSSVSIAVAPGLGTDDHVAFALAAKAYGVDVSKLRMVVYDSGGDTTTALIGHHVDAEVASVSEAEEQAKAGKLRVLGISAPERLEGDVVKDFPTFKEQGIDVEFAHWRGLMGPKDMPADQVAWWDEVLGKMVQSDTWKQLLANNGWEDAYMDSKTFAQYLEDTDKTLGELYKEIGVSKR